MSWEQDCINLYDKNADKVGKIEYKQYKNKDKIEYEAYTLLPVFHNTAAAHITVELNEKGEFLRAAAVDKEDRMTIIPITDKSDSRTAGKEPHPLCDNIKYLAGDYSQYSDEKKVREYYEAYIEKLRQWHFSGRSHCIRGSDLQSHRTRSYCPVIWPTPPHCVKTPGWQQTP